MRKFIVTLDGKRYQVEVEEVGTEQAKGSEAVAGSASKEERIVADKNVKKQDEAKPAASAPVDVPAGGVQVKAPLNGTILSVLVKEGDVVKRGDVLLTLEALKMENEIVAPSDGKVTGVYVTVGKNVETGDLLVTLA